VTAPVKRRRADRRSTSNGCSRGSSAARAARRAFLVRQFGWPELGIVLCYWCDVPLLQDEDPDAPGQAVTVDRIVPGCQGGRYTRDNIRPSCIVCARDQGGAIGAERRKAAA